jgi:hypothetical protein
MENSRDFAEQEFDRFIELNDLDFDVEGAAPDDVASVATMRRKLIKALQTGALTVDEKGVPTVHPQRSEGASPVVFHRLTGACLLAADRKGAKESIAKMFAAIAEATGTPSVALSKMHVQDAMLCQHVLSCFLA